MDINNIEEDKTKQFIKAYEEAKAQSFIIESINKDFFFEFVDCLMERIQELKKENTTLRKANNITKNLTKEVKIEDITQVMNKSYEEFMKNFIPVQKVKDKIEELEKAKRETIRENWHYIYSIQLKILEELLEDK